MTTPKEVVDYSASLVGKKVIVPTNPYGGQCVALIDHIVQHFTDGKKNLAYTNAKDCLTKASQQGFEVIHNDGSPDLIPQNGDFFVCQWGANDPFGHIGVCVSADIHGMITIEQNIDGWRDDNGNGVNDQLEIGGGGYTRNYSRNYEGVIGWFRLPYNAPKNETTQGENDMFTLSAPNRGIALIQGGTFFPILDAKDPIEFWKAGAKHIQVSTATFDAFQGKSQKSTLDDATVDKLIKGLK